MTIRVLLADDQPLLRGGFAVLIGSAPDLEVVGEAATGREAVELARSSRADVVLMDIRMPDIDGLTATRMITGDEDLAGVRVLILTTFEIDEYVFREREVLALVAAGLSNDDIAERLVVSRHTAKTHVNRAMTKLGAHDRAQLVVIAYETGLVRAATRKSWVQRNTPPLHTYLEE